MIPVPYGTVTHRLFEGYADSADSGAHPDAKLLHGIEVVLTPSVQHAVYTVGGERTTIRPAVITGVYNAQGRLVANAGDSRPLNVPATRGAAVTPTWHYRVHWRGAQSELRLDKSTTLIVDQGESVDLANVIAWPVRTGNFYRDLLDRIDDARSLGNTIPGLVSGGVAELSGARDQAISAVSDERGEAIRDIQTRHTLAVSEMSLLRDETEGLRDEAGAVRDDVMEISGLTGEDEAIAFLLDDPTSLVGQRVMQKDPRMVNVKDFGAVGDGVADDGPAVQAAIDAVPEGGTVMLPPGVYVTPYAFANDGSGSIIITKPLTLVGEGNVTLRGFHFWAQGEADPVTPVTENVAAGSRSVTAAGLTAAPGDYVQLLGEANIYSPDAGSLQFGSENPTVGGRSLARASEIHRVASVTDGQFEMLASLRYPYKSSIGAEFLHPLPGVTSAEIRRITPIRGLVVENIKFDHETIPTARRGWVIRLAAGVEFRRCRWDIAAEGGSNISITDSYDVKFENCIVNSAAAPGTAGSGSVPIQIGAGCTFVAFNNSSFSRGYTMIDVITNDMAPHIPGSQVEATKSQLRTVNDVSLRGCDFNDSNTAVTCHPAVNGFIVSGCAMLRVGAAVRPRGRNNVISGNQISSRGQAIGISAFAHNTKIIGNTITFARHELGGEAWAGVRWNPTSEETITGNNLSGLVIAGNIFRGDAGAPANYGVLLSHGNLGSGLVTDDIRGARSDIHIKDNYFEDSSIRIHELIAGVTITGNEFTDRVAGAARTFVEIMYNAAAVTVDSNQFNSLGTHISFQSLSTSIPRSYEWRHQLGRNAFSVTPNVAVANAGVVDGLGAGGSEHFQMGNAATNEANEVGKLIEVPVVFPRPFLKTPTVLITPPAQLTASISSLTTTGFTARLRVVTTTGSNVAAAWIAKGIVL